MDSSKSEGQNDGEAKGGGGGSLARDAFEAVRDVALVGLIVGATGAPVAPVQKAVQYCSGGYGKPADKKKDEDK